MKVLYHKATDHEGNRMDVEFVDGNGKLWVIPWGEPTEFENSFMADKLLEHQKYMGLVEVNFVKTRQGITYDMEDAEDRALASLVEQEKLCINDYIRTQLESRVRQNFPPLPPVGRAMSCVIKHRVNLLRYGIRPVGWEPPYEMKEEGFNVTAGQTSGSGMAVGGASIEDRMRQMEQLILKQQNLIEALTRAQGQGQSRASRSKTDPTSTTKSPSQSSSPSPSAAELLAQDTAPTPTPAINISDGADDTYDSIKL